MEKWLLIIAGIFIAFQVFFQKDHKKLAWLLGGILFFPHSIGIMSEPVALTFHRLFIYSLVLSTVIYKKEFWQQYGKMPGAIGLIVIVVANLITGILDERLGMFMKLYRPFTITIENFVLVFFAYVHTRSFEQSISLLRIYVIFMILFGVYGLSNYITGVNEYYNFLEAQFGSSDFANANMSEFAARFRVSSFAFHAIFYGLLLATGILVYVYLYFNDYSKKLRNASLVILILMLVNLVLVNSRTPVLSICAGMLIVFLFLFNYKAKLKVALAAVVVVVALLNYSPKFNELVAASFELLDPGESRVGGSSLEMRKEQLSASLDIYEEKPFAGHGFQYAGETLGYSADKSNNMAPEELRGFESYLFKLLIEQGFVGVASRAIYFATLLVFLFRSRKFVAAKGLATLTFAMLVVFLVFIFTTGSMNAFPFFMILLGSNLKGIQLVKQ